MPYYQVESTDVIGLLTMLHPLAFDGKTNTLYHRQGIRKVRLASVSQDDKGSPTFDFSQAELNGKSRLDYARAYLSVAGFLEQNGIPYTPSLGEHEIDSCLRFDGLSRSMINKSE